MLVLSCVGALSANPQPDTDCLPCDYRTAPATCDIVSCKSPLVAPTAPSGVTITSNLSDTMRAAFEHGLGRALAKTSAVAWATREIGSRVRSFVQKFAELNGTTYEAELLAAFYGDPARPSGSAHNTGFVGPNVTALDRVLQAGNIREVWGALYVLSHTKWTSSAILRLFADEAHPPSNATLESLGLDADVVYTRYELVRATNLLPGAAKYNGIPEFLSPPFNSWVCARRRTVARAARQPFVRPFATRRSASTTTGRTRQPCRPSGRRAPARAGARVCL